MEGDNVEAVARVHMLVTLMSAMVGYLIKFLVLNVNDVLIMLPNIESTYL